MLLSDISVSLKKDLRNQLRSDQVSAQNLSTEEDLIQNHLNKFLSQQAGIWAGFRSILPEPSVRKSLAQARHIQWVYPRVYQQDLEFYLVEDEGVGEEADQAQSSTRFEPGFCQIEEPVARAQYQKKISTLTGALVPALGFDVSGRRLGRGRGYYDRALQNWNGIKVGVAFRHQILAELPEEAHDVKMDYLVTSAGVIRCGLQQFNR